jgi:hypothetical protein
VQLNKLMRVWPKLLEALKGTGAKTAPEVMKRSIKDGRFATRRSRTKRYYNAEPVKHHQLYRSKLARRAYRGCVGRLIQKRWSTMLSLYLHRMITRKQWVQYIHAREVRKKQRTVRAG